MRARRGPETMTKAAIDPICNAVHLCVDMQNIFARGSIWETPWMERVLPAVAGICERYAARTVFTRFITPVHAAGTLVFAPRATALSEAAAPRAVRGRYLAAYQYAYTIAQVLAPLVVGLLAVTAWLPWVIVGSAALLAVAALPTIGVRLQSQLV